MLLDTSVTAKVLKVAPLREVQLHARLVTSDQPGIRLLAPPVEGRSFAKLPHSHLIHLVSDLGAEPVGEYPMLVAQALELVSAMKPDMTELAKLEREVSRRNLPEPDLNHHGKPSPLPAAPKPKRERSTEFQHPSRPKEGTTTGLVWDMADALRAKLGRIPSGKEMIADCDREGIKAGTVSVQFGKWKTFVQEQETS
jgi:hypothetical protein